jgi:hypothetical protein
MTNRYQPYQIAFHTGCAVLFFAGFYHGCVSNDMNPPLAATQPQPQVIDNAIPAQPVPSSNTKRPSPSSSVSSQEAYREAVAPTTSSAEKITPTSPTSGAPFDITMTIQNCRHNGSEIDCWGYITHTSDIPTQECFHWSDATDDEGRQFKNWYSPTFSDGAQITTMLPSTKYRFQLRVSDPHPAVQHLGFRIYLCSNCNTIYLGAHESNLVFTNVPVQP